MFKFKLFAWPVLPLFALLKSLLFLSSLNTVSGANILFLAGVDSPSHHFWNREIVYALAERGHNITVISSRFDENPPDNIYFMQIVGDYKKFYSKLFKSLAEPSQRPTAWRDAINYQYFCEQTSIVALKSDAVQQLLAYPTDFRFDLVLHDFTCGGAGLLAFIHRFNNPPLVVVTPYSYPSYTSFFVGGNQHYAYIPHYSLMIESAMTFWERVHNLIVYSVENLYRQYVFYSRLDVQMRNVFGVDTPALAELERSAVLALINVNFAMDYAEPLPPNVIPVAGLHIKDAKPLPADIESFINASKSGAILFSLGSNFRSDSMNLHTQKMFINAFRQLPDYHFLWKFESEMVSSQLPKNVLIRPWLPQSNILAHPKTKLFLTHAGLLSTQEAIWRGVPMLGMPFIFDQHINILKTIKLGVADAVDFTNVTTCEIRTKMLKLLDDPKYAINIKRLSHSFRDQKEMPMERAVWWIEYVLRNPQPDYLKVPTQQLGYIVGNAFDVIAFLVAITIFLGFVIAKLALITIKTICSTSKASFDLICSRMRTGGFADSKDIFQLGRSKSSKIKSKKIL